MSASDVEAQIARAEAQIEAGISRRARDRGGVLAADPRRPGAHNVLGFLAYREGRLIDAQRESSSRARCPATTPTRRPTSTVRASWQPSTPAPTAPRRRPRRRAGTSTSAAATRTCAAGASAPHLRRALLGRLLGSSDGRRSRRDSTSCPRPPRRPASAASCCASPRTSGTARGDIFENGPLLGGTTRALALGMLANPRRDPDALLHTHDWFTARSALDLAAARFEQHDRRRGSRCARARATMQRDRRLPGGLRRSCTPAGLLAAAALARGLPAGLPRRRVATTARRSSSRPSARFEPRLRRRLQELVRHKHWSERIVRPRAAAAATSSSRTSAGTRASGCRRSSARCPSTSGSSPTSTTRTPSSCCGDRPARPSRSASRTSRATSAATASTTSSCGSASTPATAATCTRWSR